MLSESGKTSVRHEYCNEGFRIVADAVLGPLPEITGPISNVEKTYVDRSRRRWELGSEMLRAKNVRPGKATEIIINSAYHTA